MTPEQDLHRRKALTARTDNPHIYLEAGVWRFHRPRGNLITANDRRARAFVVRLGRNPEVVGR